MLAPEGDLPLGHDGYLKLWSIDCPRLDAAFILLDEAQDSNPAVLHVLRNQHAAQVIYVGDPHQQIYEWRGAIDAMSSVPTEHHVHLTRSFRFGEEIAGLASRLLAQLGEPKPVIGDPRIASRIANDFDASAVLARTNSAVIGETLEAHNRNRRAYIVGGTGELERLVRDVYDLKAGKPGCQPEFYGFASWQEVVEFAGSEEGESLKTFVNLVQKNGPDRLWAAIKSSVAEPEQCDVVVSTAHKAKGREWNSVRIANDFSGSRSADSPVPKEELRLLYVAMTRAREVLAIDPGMLAGYCTPTAAPEPKPVRVQGSASPTKNSADQGTTREHMPLSATARPRQSGPTHAPARTDTSLSRIVRWFLG